MFLSITGRLDGFCKLFHPSFAECAALRSIVDVAMMQPKLEGHAGDENRAEIWTVHSEKIATVCTYMVACGLESFVSFVICN